MIKVFVESQDLEEFFKTTDADNPKDRKMKKMKYLEDGLEK